jgi:hypothetical protein
MSGDVTAFIQELFDVFVTAVVFCFLSLHPYLIIVAVRYSRFS